jgi:hypothetical protein
MSYIFELELIHFCSTIFNGFWATLPNIFHLDPKPCYNPWKVLMILVMHVTPVMENEKICKPMVDHFHWNEFERNTYPSNTWESSVYFPLGSTFLVYSIFEWKCLLSNYKLFKNVYSWYVMSFEELGCSLLMALQPWCFYLGRWIWVLLEDEQKLSVGEFNENAKCHIFLH